MSIQLEQRVDIRKIAPTRWRLVGYVGRAIFFYGEAGTESPTFTVNNELGQGDLGSWRAVDNRRGMVVGFGGKATVAPKPEGNPGELQVQFEGIGLVF